MIIRTALVFVTTFWCLAAPAVSATTERLFPTAKMLTEKEEAERHYLLPLGRVKPDRDMGRNVPARFKRLDGRFHSQVWELSGEYTMAEATASIQEYVASPAFEVLYQCTGRDCGESFSWANSVFNESIVYGNDRNQSLWTVKDKGAQSYHVFYLSERPNRRKYFYEEALYVPDQQLSADFIRSQLERNGYLMLGEVVLEADQAQVAPIVEKLLPHAKVAPLQRLVVHRHGPMLDHPIVPALKQALAAAGLSVDVVDVADSAPRADAPGNAWVEWVAPGWRP